MEKFIKQTEIILGLLQEKMTDESYEKSAAAGTKIYEYIGQIAEDEKLTIHELWNAVMTINLGVLELALESTKGE